MKKNQNLTCIWSRRQDTTMQRGLWMSNGHLYADELSISYSSTMTHIQAIASPKFSNSCWRPHLTKMKWKNLLFLKKRNPNWIMAIEREHYLVEWKKHYTRLCDHAKPLYVTGHVYLNFLYARIMVLKLVCIAKYVSGSCYQFWTVII